MTLIQILFEIIRQKFLQLVIWLRVTNYKLMQFQDIQQKYSLKLQLKTLSVTKSNIMQDSNIYTVCFYNVVNADCQWFFYIFYAECDYAKRHYADCHYAECHLCF